MGEPSRAVGRPIFALDLRGLPPPHTFTRKDNENPLSVAPKTSGGKIAPSHDFRMIGAIGHMEFPPAPTDFLSWELRDRLTQRELRDRITQMEDGDPFGAPREWGGHALCPVCSKHPAGDAQNDLARDVDFPACARPSWPPANDEYRRTAGVFAHGVPECLR